MNKATLLLMVLSLLLLAGRAALNEQESRAENPGRTGGVAEGGRIKLPEPESMPVYGKSNRPIPPPPPAWLVIGGEVVQASYGLSCESGACNGKEPRQQASELASVETPADEKALVVVGSDRSVELTAGVVGWEEAPDGPTPPSVFTGSGVPYFLRVLDARPVPEGERPAVELASGGEGDLAAGYTVFELASTGNPGDRLLSVFAYTGESLGQEDRTAYHWRLDPGEEGENLPPEEEDLPEVVELERGPETVELSPEEAAEQTSLRDVEEASFGRPGKMEATGESYLWVRWSPKRGRKARTVVPRRGKP